MLIPVRKSCRAKFAYLRRTRLERRTSITDKEVRSAFQIKFAVMKQFVASTRRIYYGF
jgi:hypothetical protein